MTEFWESYTVRCPFYQGENKRNIRCEGLTAGTATLTEFPEGGKLKFKRRFCDRSYNICPLCDTLRKKYEAREAWDVVI